MAAKRGDAGGMKGSTAARQHNAHQQQHNAQQQQQQQAEGIFSPIAAEAALSERWTSPTADGKPTTSSESTSAGPGASVGVWGSKNQLVLEAGVKDFEQELMHVWRKQSSSASAAAAGSTGK